MRQAKPQVVRRLLNIYRGQHAQRLEIQVPALVKLLYRSEEAVTSSAVAGRIPAWVWQTSLLTFAAAGLLQAHADMDEERLSPESLRELAADLVTGAYADRERAVAILSGLTIYLENHAAILKSEVLPALMNVVSNPKAESTVRVVALGCAADLLKTPQAYAYLKLDAEFLPTLAHAIRGEGSWEQGPEQGGLAKSHAARALAELAAEEQLHPLLMHSGAVDAIIGRGAELAQLNEEHARQYDAPGAAPGNTLEMHSVAEERFVATTIFGLTGSPAGMQMLLQDDAASLTAMRQWALSRDPILQRFGAGGIARAAVGGVESLSAIVNAGGLQALVAGLTIDDPQANCYATGAIGKLAGKGDKPVSDLLRLGAPEHVLQMLQKPASGTVSRQNAKQVGTDSPGVRKGVQRCALRCIIACAHEPHLQKAFVQAEGVPRLKAYLDSLNPATDTELTALAREASNRLSR